MSFSSMAKWSYEMTEALEVYLDITGEVKASPLEANFSFNILYRSKKQLCFLMIKGQNLNMDNNNFKQVPVKYYLFSEILYLQKYPSKYVRTTTYLSIFQF